MTGRLIRITTALAVTVVAAVAAIISYRHAYELVSTHGETGLTARLVLFTVDGLILAASMLILDASRRNQPVPPLTRCAWAPGSRRRLAPTWRTAWAMARSERWSAPEPASAELVHAPGSAAAVGVRAVVPPAPDLEQTIGDWHGAGHSQRAIARELSIDRRKVKLAITARLA